MVSADGYPGDRRRHRRFTHPSLSLLLDGQVYATHDWSLGGFVVDDYTGPLSAGSLFTIEAIGEDPAALTPVAIRSRVVRADRGDRRLTANFLVIDTTAYSLLQRLVGQRIKPIDAPPPPS